MDATTQGILKMKSLSLIKTDLLSTLLVDKLPSTVFSLQDLQNYPFVVDLTGVSGLSNIDMKGIQFLSKIETLIIPSSANLTANSIDVSSFTSIKILQSLLTIKSPFRGSLSSLTTLVNFTCTFGTGERYPLTLPVFSNNHNIEVISVNGGDSGSGTYVIPYTINDFINLSVLRKLKTFKATYWQGLTNKTVIDYILAQLRIAKAAGCPLTSIDMTGSKAPTGGNTNADYLALVAAGVTVTLGTAV